MEKKELIDNLEYCYQQIKKEKEHNITKCLQIILESKNSYWNYRVATLYLSYKKIPSNERISYVIRHAEILFENNDLEYIIRFLKNIYNKPIYEEYLKSKESIEYYQEQLKQKIKKAREAEEARQKELSKIKNIEERKYEEIRFVNKTELEISEYILNLNNPEYDYYAITNLRLNPIQKEKHFQRILDSKNPYWNYKCVKKIFRSNLYEKPEKVKKIYEHSQIVINNNDKEIINKLVKFLKNKKIYNALITDKKYKVKKYSRRKK